MYRFIFIASLFCLLMSCREQRQLVQSTRQDSVNIEYRDVEKIVRIPGDTVFMNMQVARPDDNSVETRQCHVSTPIIPQTQTIETKRAKVKLSVNSQGQIQVQSVCKELEEKVSVLEKTITIQRSEIKEYQVKESRSKALWQSMAKYARFAFFTIAIVAIAMVVTKIGNPLNLIKNLLK